MSADKDGAAKPRTIDEITQEIERIAFDPDAEGPAKLRALRLLQQDQGGVAISLPPPLTEEQMINRLGRVMKGCGTAICQRAYARTFPKAGTRIDAQVLFALSDVPEALRAQVSKIKTLWQLNQRFPNEKIPGVPKGYPMSAGALAKEAFVQRLAMERLLKEHDALRPPHEAAENDPLSEMAAHPAPQVRPAPSSPQ